VCREIKCVGLICKKFDNKIKWETQIEKQALSVITKVQKNCIFFFFLDNRKNKMFFDLLKKKGLYYELFPIKKERSYNELFHSQKPIKSLKESPSTNKKEWLTTLVVSH